ncbi:MAG: hypothetical protein ACAH88_09995, partial [Roseimicrobium sp.]
MRIVFPQLPLAGICAAWIGLHAVTAANPQVAAAASSSSSAPKAAPAASSSATLKSSAGPWVLYAPRFSGDTVLLDGKGQEAHVWTGGAPGAQSARLQPDGSILRLASMRSLPATFAGVNIEGGRLQRFS